MEVAGYMLPRKTATPSDFILILTHIRTVKAQWSVIGRGLITINLVWIVQQHTQTGLVVLEQECH